MSNWADDLDEQCREEGIQLPSTPPQPSSADDDAPCNYLAEQAARMKLGNSFRRIVGSGSSALQQTGSGAPDSANPLFSSSSQRGFDGMPRGSANRGRGGSYVPRGDMGGAMQGGFDPNDFDFGGLPASPQYYDNNNMNCNAPSFYRGPSSRGHAPRGGYHPNISKRFVASPANIEQQVPQFPQSNNNIRPLGGADLPAKSARGDNETVENPMSPEEIALLNKFIHRTVNHMKNGTVDIVNQQQDPSSPLHSLVNFRELRIKDDLLKALDIMGFQQPSKIQEFALPLLLMEPPTNMIAQSQSGTGKTAAFVLTMLTRVKVEEKYPQCLCLAPTFELAMQIGEVVKKMAQFMPDVKVHYAVKGSKARGTQLTEQIIIGTPGTLLDYLTKIQPFNPSKIKCIVLDEADVMISQQGHKDRSLRIYNFIEQASPNVQALLFSATYDEEVISFAEQLIKKAVMVTLRKEEQTLSNIKQYYVECANRDAKYDAVVNLYSGMTIASAIIFCHTKQSAAWLAVKMAEKGHGVALLHGDLVVEERAASIEQFKDGFFKVLITTNVCARGIDVSQVSIVINYDPPIIHQTGEPDYDTYLHRIGRTGRFGKPGIAINFVDSKENLNIINKIANNFQKPIVKLDPADIDQLEAIENDD